MSFVAAVNWAARAGTLPEPTCALTLTAAHGLAENNGTVWDSELIIWGIELATYYLERQDLSYEDLSGILTHDLASEDGSNEAFKAYLPIWYAGATGLMGLANTPVRPRS